MIFHKIEKRDTKNCTIIKTFFLNRIHILNFRYNMPASDKGITMSRGFVKESDQEELPLVPPRADLPMGTINYVTELGYQDLLLERDNMIHERDNLLISDENENRITVNFLNAKLKLLLDRISTAKIVNLSKQPKNKIRFGAEVCFKVDSDPKIQNYQIVGVDEANIPKKKIAFNSPIAKILIDKKVDDVAVLQLEKVRIEFKILSITY